MTRDSTFTCVNVLLPPCVRSTTGPGYVLTRVYLSVHRGGTHNAVQHYPEVPWGRHLEMGYPISHNAWWTTVTQNSMGQTPGGVPCQVQPGGATLPGGYPDRVPPSQVRTGGYPGSLYPPSARPGQGGYPAVKKLFCNPVRTTLEVLTDTAGGMPHLRSRRRTVLV